MPNGDLGKGIRKLKNMPEPAEKPAPTAFDDDFMAMDEELYSAVEKPSSTKKSTPPPTVSKSLEEGEEREDGEEMEEVVDTPVEATNAYENERQDESEDVHQEEAATKAEVTSDGLKSEDAPIVETENVVIDEVEAKDDDANLIVEEEPQTQQQEEEGEEPQQKEEQTIVVEEDNSTMET
jgi:hypothetical protein